MKKIPPWPGRRKSPNPLFHSGRLLALSLFISAPISSAEPALNFPVSSVTLPTGESQVLTFLISEPYSTETSPEWKIEPPGSIEMLVPPKVLAGEKIGFFRIRPTLDGLATVQIQSARLDILGRPSQKKAGQSRLPEIITPSGGAAVWGKIHAAVEVFATDKQTKEARLELKGSDGKTYQPDPTQSSQSGPWRREVFALETDSWPKGVYMLSPLLTGDTGNAVAGPSLILMRADPDPDHQIAGECENHLEVSEQERFKNYLPKAVDEPGASGGKSVQALAGNQPWTLKTEIREGGDYQLFMTVRGDPAGGAFPSVGFYVGEQEKTSGNARLAMRERHRLPVGVPVRLEQGPHVLTVQFRNDFYVEKTGDRNMWLDRFELAKVRTSARNSASGQDSMMMGMGATEPKPMMMAAMDSSEAPTKSEPVRLAFKEPLDGRQINGPVTIEALCRWAQYNPANAPAVDLLVNGRNAGTQYGTDLRFEVGLESFRPGKNHIQLVTKHGPATFNSSVQHLFLNAPAHWKPASSGRSLTYGILDPSWDLGMHQRWEGKNGEARRDAAFYSNGESYLRLPNDLKGRFKVELEGRGQSFEGPPVLEVVLRAEGIETKVGSVQMDGGRVKKSAGNVEFSGGEKQLVVRFVNDYAKDKGDRNAWLRRLLLTEVVPRSNEDVSPNLLVSYPGLNTEVGSCGLVVLDGLGIRKGDRAEVLLGDQVLGSAEAPQDGLGSWLVPWLLRTPPVGPERLWVRVLNGKDTPPVMEVSIPVRFVGQDVLTEYDKALHLLNRFGYGPEPELMAEILVKGAETWLEARLREDIDQPSHSAMQDALAIRFPGEERPNDISARVLAELQQTSNPVRARFVMWAENHFSTWQQKVGALNKWEEHESFNRQGIGRFKDLLATSASSPAMLVYLDQHRSFAKKLNENYAREILELHTVGVKGGYNQEDVTSLARLLTGWTLSEEVSTGGRSHDLVSTFRYEPGLNAKGPHRVMGMLFPEVPPEERYDRACMALEMLSMHPSTSRFICRKLIEHYVVLPAPEELVASLSEVYLSSGGDLTAVLVAMTRRPEFWESIKTPRMTTPLDYAVRMSRMIDRGGIRETGAFLKLSGMGLFDRATPDGYPQSDASYADSNALLQRWRWTSEFRFAPLRQPWERQAPATWSPDQRQWAIDWMSLRLNGLLLGSQSNQALLTWLESKNDARDDMSTQLGMMVARVPESNLR